LGAQPARPMRSAAVRMATLFMCSLLLDRGGDSVAGRDRCAINRERPVAAQRHPWRFATNSGPNAQIVVAKRRQRGATDAAALAPPWSPTGRPPAARGRSPFHNSFSESPSPSRRRRWR
jgi:hypothetical protein